MTTENQKPAASRVLFWLIVAATFALYLAIVAWSAPVISIQADGLLIFDLRPTGYSYQEANAFLTALTDEGRRFYLSVQHRLDTVFPALNAITLAWALHLLMPANRLARICLLLPVFAMIFDYAENRAVAAMLHSGAQNLTQEMVDRASLFSMLKAGLTTVSMGLLLVLVSLRVYRMWAGWRARGAD